MQQNSPSMLESSAAMFLEEGLNALAQTLSFKSNR
jgi:hypothetical protein